MTATAPRPFGRALCAMITPFTAAGALDVDAARAHAARLVAEGCDGIVLSGTTGESPTTTDAEKSALLRTVRAEVGDGVPLLSGVGGPDTATTLRLARQAEEAGADGLLVVSPYYSRPPQAAVEAYFLRVAESTGLPLMLYDIPGRTGVRIEPETLLRLAEHPRVVAVKDCSCDLLGATKVLARTSPAVLLGQRGAEPSAVRGGRRGLRQYGRERGPASDAGTAGRVRRGPHRRGGPPQRAHGPARRADDGERAAGDRHGEGAPGQPARSGNRCSPPGARRPTGCGRRTRSSSRPESGETGQLWACRTSFRPPQTALFGRASTVPVTELRRKRMFEAPDSSRALTT